jgi:hypothetical protein
MLTAPVIGRAPWSTESAAMARYRLSKRLSALVDFADYLDGVGADTASTKADIWRTLRAMSAIDRLCTANTGETP